MLIPWVGLRTNFNSWSGLGFACPVKRNGLVISSQGRCAFVSLPSSVGWDDLVDPRTLAFYCLGLEPSAFVLRNLNIEGKKSKF